LKNKLFQILKNEKPILFLVIFVFILSGYFLLKNTLFKVKGASAAATKVVVWIDNEKLWVSSTSEEPEKVLAENNIKLWPEDKIETSLILDPITDGGAGQKITITRAPVYAVAVDDGVQEIHSWGKSIEEVLSGKVTLSPRDIVEPSRESQAVPGEIVITRINVAEIDETASIPYSTTTQNDYFTPAGVNKVTTPGSNGEKLKHLRVTYKNGVEVNRVLLSESVTKPPVTEVVKKGLMPSGDRDFKRQYWDIMVAAGQKYGVSPLDLFEVASCESHVNPYSQSEYYGMFQYSATMWQRESANAGFAGAVWSDATAQIYTTARYVSKSGWGPWGCKP
jgi:hypothetical protein